MPKNFTKLVVAEKCDSFGNLQLIQSVNGVEMFVEKSRKSLGLSFTRSMYQRLVYDNIGHFLYCQVQETSMFSKPRTVNYYLTFKKQRNKVTLAWTKHKSKAKQTILQALENNRYEADYDDEADWSACSEVTHTAEEDEVTLETGEEDQAYTPISSPHHRSQCPLPIEDSPCRYNSRHHSQSPLLVDISPRSHNLKNDPPVKSPDISPPCHQYHSPSNDSPNLSPLPSPTTPLAHNQFQSPPDSRSSPNHLVGNSPLSGCSSGLTDARGDGFQHLQNPTTSHKGTQADISPPDASAPEHPETCEYAETEPIQEPCQTTSMSDEDVPVDPVSAPGNLETRQDTEPKAIHEPCQRATMSYEGLPVDPVSAPGYLEARGCAETGPGHPLKAHTQLDPRIQSAPTRSNVSASVTLSSGFTSGLPEALLEIIRELLGKDAVDFLCAFKSRTSTRDSTQFRVTQSDFNRLERDFGKFAAECRKYGLVKKGRDPNTGKVFYYVYFKVLDTFLATQAKRTIQKAISSQSALVHLYSKPEGKVRKCMAKIEGFYSEVKDDFVVKYKDVSITVSGLDKIANAVRVFESVEHVRHPGGAKFANLTATYRNSLKVLNLVGQALDGSPFVYRHTNLYL
uniref:Uncharacterized protein n=1 Tax=Mucochytrium quahogii TaxID=96639 RepID=A0A7S2RZ66_9STRA